MKLFNIICLGMYLIMVMSTYGMSLIEEHPEIALLMIENEQCQLRTRRLGMPAVRKVSSMHSIVGSSDGESHLDQECAVCLEDYTDGRPLTQLMCDPKRKISHTFCKACLIAWTEKKNDCPQCRRIINEQPPIVEQFPGCLIFNFAVLTNFFSCGNCPFEEIDEP